MNTASISAGCIIALVYRKMPEAINIQQVFAKHVAHVNKVLQFEIRIRKFLKKRRIAVIDSNSCRKI